MRVLSDVADPELVQTLLSGGTAIIRTDTLYGVVVSARNHESVERVYELKGRTDSKSPIVLIASPEQMFDTYAADTMTQLDRLWPGPRSIILPSLLAPKWITRGNASVAYRIPDNADLRRLLTVVGPLIAPSANPEGMTPALTIQEAKHYFGDRVDIYVDGGTVTDTTPSQLLRLADNGELERLR